MVLCYVSIFTCKLVHKSGSVLYTLSTTFSLSVLVTNLPSLF